MRPLLPLLICLLLVPAPARGEGDAAEADPAERGWIGIVFNAVDDGARVKLVLPGMPASAAGLKQGDVLLTVDGNPLAGLGIKDIQVAMGGLPETTAQVTLRRGKKELELAVERIHRPSDEQIQLLRAQAELMAKPAHQRVHMRLRALGEEPDAEAVLGVWRTYLAEKGEGAKVQETVVTSMLKALAAVGDAAAVDGLEAQVLPVVDADAGLAGNPRVHRRVADYYLVLEPVRHEAAAARALRGLELAPADHQEHPWLQRALGQALLGGGDIDGALEASAAALGAYAPATLIWIDAAGTERDRLVVDGHSRLVILRARALQASGDPEGAAAVLRDRLRHRYNEDTAALLQDIAGDEPAPPRPAFPIAAEPFPEFSLPLIGHQGEVTLADLAGRPTLVVLWASWCSPCKAEMAHLATVYPELQEAGIQVLAINVMDESGKARAAYDAGAWPFPVVMDYHKQLTKTLGIQSIPRAYAIDPAGNVVETYQGYSEAGAAEQAALLRALASGEQQTPHLVEVEVGEERLKLVAFHALPLARSLAQDGDDGALWVATAHGQLYPVGPDGLDTDAERLCPYKIRRLEVLPGGTCVATGKKHVTLLAAGDEPVILQGEGNVMATAVVGERLVVGRSGKRRLFAFAADGSLAWSGGEEAVTWDLAPLGGEDGSLQVGRLRPDGLEILGLDGQTRDLRTLPQKVSRFEAASGEVILSRALVAMSRGDLDGDGRDETVVLLNTRQVVGLTPEHEVLFRFTLPVDGDIECADLDGDGRDELWVASAAAGVACFQVRGIEQ